MHDEVCVSLGTSSIQVHPLSCYSSSSLPCHGALFLLEHTDSVLAVRRKVLGKLPIVHFVKSFTTALPLQVLKSIIINWRRLDDKYGTTVFMYMTCVCVSASACLCR